MRVEKGLFPLLENVPSGISKRKSIKGRRRPSLLHSKSHSGGGHTFPDASVIFLNHADLPYTYQLHIHLKPPYTYLHMGGGPWGLLSARPSWV